MAKKKKNNGKQKRQKRDAALGDALESNRRIVQYAETATTAIGLRDAPADELPDQAIRERAAGLMYAAALMMWHWSPQGTASEQFTTMATQTFTMAGQTLLAHAHTSQDVDEK